MLWNYSISYVKNNKASSVSIMVAALVCGVCLSFLCGIFYNNWAFEVDDIVLREGGWHARITGGVTNAEAELIRGFANVESAAMSGDDAVDVIFVNPRTAFSDVPAMIEQLGLKDTSAQYHVTLLSKYLINDPNDPTPPLLMAFSLAVFLVVAFSLVLIIHNSFAVSMDARVRQLGVLTCVGATPRQIRLCLIREAAALCLVPIIAGCLAGTGLCYLAIQGVNRLTAVIPGGREAVFRNSPALFFLAFASSVITVVVSAWIPARRLSRLTPLQAIVQVDEPSLKRRRRFRLLTALFGIEGRLGGNALRARRRALRASNLSLTLSFLGFTVMLCFLTLSGISTRHTYFERYQDTWDAMITVEDSRIEDFGLSDELQNLPGARDVVVYQKAEAVTPVPESLQSDELKALGGFENVAKSKKTSAKAPVVIMDDASFLRYCESVGEQPRLDGAIVLNDIWDSLNTSFRYKSYVPFLGGDAPATELMSVGNSGSAVELPVVAYVGLDKAPVLREEYSNFSLVHVIPVSVWREIAGVIGAAEDDIYIRALAQEGAEQSVIEAVENEIVRIVSGEYQAQSENRESEKAANDQMLSGYALLLGGFCALLAVIGIANVFSCAMGFMRQRRREFARYMSVGMTKGGMRKLFAAEALVIAGRPVLITLILTTIFVGLMIRASFLNPMEFLAEAPVAPIAAFCLAIFALVATAYFIGARRLLTSDLSGALRDETMI